MRVFVYGTLKRGIHNHHLLGDSEFLGIAYTIDPFKMFNVGFPVIRPADDGKSVAGEVYDVDETILKRLDHLEQEGRMYDRKVTGIAFPTTQRQMEMVDQAFIYVGNEKYWGSQNPTPYVDTNAAGELEWRSV